MKYPLLKMLDEIQRDSRAGEGGQAKTLSQEEIRQRIQRRKDAERAREPKP